MPDLPASVSACVTELGGRVSIDIQTRTQSVFDELAARQTWKIKHVIYIVLGAALLAWCADGVNLRPREVFNAVPIIADYFARMVPPKWSFIEAIWKPSIETLHVALWGVVLATIVGLPLGLLAASTVTRSAALRGGAMGILNVLRSISELIWAILFVAAVGLGPFPGALALGMNYGGILGRLYAEAIENVDKGPIEAMQATGASRLQVILLAILPQALPQFVTYNLYWFEVGVRSATVLGMVGAGGIGFELITSIRLFEWREVGVILLFILGMVTVIDLASTYIRSRLY
jgi:phosphonate transport system permease protein